ncbi:hypothetical protein EDC18_11125 [Natranaerovirga pectinivora]|uniref:Oligosaccharide repeat unit polymerase n=1 Tax=Natranaerovirga pectinivora TaxID=682400 RepID=A0A4R3MGH0_9FIRM|nr:O-antigen polymerase [Natranaerovirga pectinivora]TCT12854.1 hypothetical protein EDC18_11125 [Natranaerovirga pectinivora]
MKTTKNISEFTNYIKNAHSITLKRVIAAVSFNIIMMLFFLSLYKGNLNFSTLLLMGAFSLLLSPIFFVKDMFHPIYIFITIQILPLINFLEKDLYGKPFRYAMWLIDNEYHFIMAYSLLIIIVWFVFLYGGFLIVSNQKSIIRLSPFRYALNSPISCAKIILIISVITYLYILFEMGGFMSMINMMSNRVELYSGKAYLINIVKLGSLASILYLYGGRVKSSVLINVATFIAMSTFGGRERAFFGVVFPYLIFYNYSYKKIKLRNLIFIIIPAVFFGILWGNLRRYGDLSLMGVELGNLLFAVARGKATADILPSLIALLLNGDIQFNFGKTLINIFFAPIPRILWSSKPSIDDAGIVGEAILGQNYWGLPPRSYGLAFFNFHWFGVILLAVITGVIIRKLYNRMLKTRVTTDISDFWIVLFYSLNIRYIFNVFSTASQINIIWNTVMILLVYFIDRVLVKKNKVALIRALKNET